MDECGVVRRGEVEAIVSREMPNNHKSTVPFHLDGIASLARRRAAQNAGLLHGNGLG